MLRRTRFIADLGCGEEQLTGIAGASLSPYDETDRRLAVKLRRELGEEVLALLADGRTKDILLRFVRVSEMAPAQAGQRSRYYRRLAHEFRRSLIAEAVDVVVFIDEESAVAAGARFREVLLVSGYRDGEYVVESV